MDPNWCRNVAQDGSFHGTKDGVCTVASNHTSEASVKEEEGGGSSRTTRTTPRNTRIGFRGFRTIHIRSPPKGGLLIGRVLMVLEVVLVVLEVVLVVLEVTGPQVPWGIFQIRLSLRPDLYSPAPPIRFCHVSGCFSSVWLI